MPNAELEELIVADAAELRAWLAENHATSPGVWLALTRKGGTVTTLTWQQAVDEALCFGWIDGQARKRDEGSSWIRYTPRRARSIWSQRNVENVARLEAGGGSKRHSPSIATLRKYAEAVGCRLEIRLRPRRSPSPSARAAARSPSARP